MFAVSITDQGTSLPVEEALPPHIVLALEAKHAAFLIGFVPAAR